MDPVRALLAPAWFVHRARCEAAGVCAWAMLREELFHCGGRCTEVCVRFNADAPRRVLPESAANATSRINVFYRPGLP